MRYIVGCLLVLLTCSNGLAQQQYVSRYDVFTGFSYFPTLSLNLYQRGFNATAGVNARRWVALGGDFSVFTGGSSLTPGQLSPSQQARLAPFLPLLPPGYVISVPYNVKTYTYAAGPQLICRRLKSVSFFVRPALGAIHQSVRAKPRDAIQTSIVAAVLPNGDSDTVAFYGVGGGFDTRTSEHFGLRVAADFVHMGLFKGFLKEPQNAVRLSVGPTFRFGRNVQ